VNFVLSCDLVCTSGVIFSDLVEMVIVRSSLGELGITFGHAPLLADLVPGSVRIITQSGDDLVFSISGGFLEVQNNKIKILAITAEREL